MRTTVDFLNQITALSNIRVKEISETMTASDGGLTIAGCDAHQDLVIDLREIFEILYKRGAPIRPELVKLSLPTEDHEGNLIAFGLLAMD